MKCSSAVCCVSTSLTVKLFLQFTVSVCPSSLLSVGYLWPSLILFTLKFRNKPSNSIYCIYKMFFDNVAASFFETSFDSNSIFFIHPQVCFSVSLSLICLCLCQSVICHYFMDSLSSIFSVCLCWFLSVGSNQQNFGGLTGL